MPKSTDGQKKSKTKSKILTLDLSTKSTGWALFEAQNLKEYGIIKPKVSGISKYKYPKAALYKIRSVSAQTEELIKKIQPDLIIIEEVNRGVNRIAQKSLDALHFFVLNRLKSEDLDKVEYIDSNGAKGWRGILGLKLSKLDKEKNAKIRKNNKKTKLKKPVINAKTLAMRYVSTKLGIYLDIYKNKSNEDLNDAICIGLAYLKKTP